MSRRCEECGALLGAADNVCRACGHPAARGAGPESSGAPRPRRPVADPDASTGGSRSSLGDIPAASEGDAFDLSAILDPMSAPPPSESASRGRGGFVPAFTFPGVEPEPVPLGDEMPQDLAPEPLAASAEHRPPPASATSANDPWRVRNANGATYDMVSVDSVVQWLQNKDSFDGIRIARGNGPFRTVEDYPELVARLGLRSEVGGFSSSDPAPKLDLDAAPRRPQGSRAPAAQRPVESRGGRAAPSGPTPAAAKGKDTRARPPERPLGMGFTLILTAVSALLTFGGVHLLEGLGAAPPLHAEAVANAAVPPAEPGPNLQAALQHFEAQRYTAAEQLLQQAARSEREKGDPRVFRYLAQTLAKLGGRDREARAALAEYRRLRARETGD